MYKLTLLFFFLPVLLVPGSVSGQSVQSQSDPETILRSMTQSPAQLAGDWLHSSDARLQAWGAYLVARDHLSQYSPELIGLMREHEVVPGWSYANSPHDPHDAMLAVLDAVIQVGVNVTANDTTRLFPEFPAQTLILLSRSEQREDAAGVLLKIFSTEKEYSVAWLAAGNILAQWRPPGFAFFILNGMTTHVYVHVLSSGGFPIVDGGFECISLGDPFLEPKSGWPEIGRYRLTDGFWPQSKPTGTLGEGKFKAYYFRIVDGFYGRAAPGACSIPPDQDYARQLLIATLLHSQSAYDPLPSYDVHQLIWHDEADFEAKIRSFIHDDRAIFSQVVQRLQDEKLLTEHEADTAMPRFEIQIEDNREGENPALPQVPENIVPNVTVKPTKKVSILKYLK